MSKKSFKYVYWREDLGKYETCLKYKGKKYHVGLFDSEMDCFYSRIKMKERLIGKELLKRKQQEKDLLNNNILYYYVF